MLPAAVAEGSPITDKQHEAAALEAQISSSQSRMDSLSEQLNGAKIRLQQAQVAIADSERRTAEAQAATDKIREQLNARAAEIYKGAGTSNPLDAVDVNTVTDLAARSKYASAAADNDDTLLAKLQQAREILAVQKAQLETQKAAATAQRDAADRARTQLQATTAQRTSLLSQVKGQLKTLVAQEAVRRANASRAAAQATARRFSTGGSGSSSRGPIQQNFPNAPAPNGRAAAAVAFAKAQVGKGYVYATSGPSTFDCSGLTAAAWAAAGVGLAHYSGAQYQQTIRIGPGDLQPGDLVFYGPGGSRHVEIYIGGGMVVSAANPAEGVITAGVRYGSASGYGRVG
ncbi:MAG TPA: NlpC/P60 family protein [Acidimicrobiia bacterium]|jgi:cell wall-associated NlpC family hydrolase